MSNSDKTVPLDPGTDAPRSPLRRRLLSGLAALGGAAAGGALPDSAMARGRLAARIVPFYGRRQAGITTPQPPFAIVAAFDVLATDAAGLRAVLRTLTERCGFLMGGGSPPDLDPKFPPADSGLLGRTIVPDRMTVTLGVGASLFDDRFGLAAVKPRHLTTMEPFPNDELQDDLCHGDLSVQICAGSAEATIYALRDIMKNTPEMLALRWKIDGFLPIGVGHRSETPRNLLGFKDGTANPDNRDDSLMMRLVWVQAGSGEPAWATDGSYQVVRVIRNFVEHWDRTPLQEQEAIIGRSKDSGAPLGTRYEHDDPPFKDDAKDDRVPVDAHIRLANPRTRATDANRVLRRGYNYTRGVTGSGQLDMGLLFVCYQANLAEGFLTVQGRLNGEPLEEYIRPFGGGYFFALPGVTRRGEYLGQALLDAGAGFHSQQPANQRPDKKG